ncbi:MAG TPA: AI-2E family transporter [Saprospiraceae bacterium]|nr:AI-2E family transporter [Saprospiraceae bacterium]
MKWNARTLAIFVGVVIFFFLLYYFSDIVSFILIAWVLSLIARPFTRMLKRILSWGKFVPGNSMVALITMLVFLFLIVLVGWLFIPLVVDQANNLSHVDLNAINRTLQVPLAELKTWLVNYRLIDQRVDINEQLLNGLKKIVDPTSLGFFFKSAMSVAGNVLITITSVMFILFFFLKDEGSFDNFLKSIVPERHEERVSQALTSIANMLRRYFTGILLQVAILTSFLFIVLSIMNIKNALLIAFFGALMNVIPYLGIIIAIAFGSMITISSNIDLPFYATILPMVIKVITAFLVTQLLDNILVQPFVYSNSVKAHPLEIFLVILVAAKIGGVMGMLIAVPTFTSLKVIARVFFHERRIVQAMTKSMDSF